ncbi:MAG TPA: metal-dependent hydrolase [Terriglobia bacterium]|nr:metal-dependent hydrolase [Terriglobia bacterium]
MDNLTHTLTGFAISYAGLNRKTRYATLAAVLGANLPDVDLVSRFWGNAIYLKYHRGLTHSILGATVLAALLAIIVYFVGRRRSPAKSGPPLNGGWLFIACWIATASHLLFDFATSYGIRLFMPFNGHWYAWDIEPIIDPVLWAVLIAGLGLPFLFRLITEEVGGRKTGYRLGAIVALLAMVAWLGVRDLAHRRALNMLDARIYREENPQRLGAFPTPGNPFSWNAVVETQSAYYVFPVDVFQANVDPQDARIFRKPEPSPALEAALKTRTAAIFMDFARFPWAEVITNENGPAVMIQDLRYQPPNFHRGGFVVRIEFNKELRVQSQAFSFTGKFQGS